MGTPVVSPLKTQNALSSAVGLRGKRTEEEERKITVNFYNTSVLG